MAFAMHIHAGRRSTPVGPEAEVVIVVGRRTTALLVEAAALAGRIGVPERQRGAQESDHPKVIRADGWDAAALVASQCPRCAVVFDATAGEPRPPVRDSQGRPAKVLTFEKVLAGAAITDDGGQRRGSLLGRWLRWSWADGRQ